LYKTENFSDTFFGLSKLCCRIYIRLFGRWRVSFPGLKSYRKYAVKRAAEKRFFYWAGTYYLPLTNELLRSYPGKSGFIQIIRHESKKPCSGKLVFPETRLSWIYSFFGFIRKDNRIKNFALNRIKGVTLE